MTRKTTKIACLSAALPTIAAQFSFGGQGVGGGNPMGQLMSQMFGGGMGGGGMGGGNHAHGHGHIDPNGAGKTVSFDFDGTMHSNPTPDYVGAPMHDTLDKIRRYFDAGYRVVITTARKPEDNGEVMMFLRQHGLNHMISDVFNAKNKAFVLKENNVIKHYDDQQRNLDSISMFNPDIELAYEDGRPHEPSLLNQLLKQKMQAAGASDSTQNNNMFGGLLGGLFGGQNNAPVEVPKPTAAPKPAPRPVPKAAPKLTTREDEIANMNAMLFGKTEPAPEAQARLAPVPLTQVNQISQSLFGDIEEDEVDLSAMDAILYAEGSDSSDDDAYEFDTQTNMYVNGRDSEINEMSAMLFGGFAPTKSTPKPRALPKPIPTAVAHSHSHADGHSHGHGHSHATPASRAAPMPAPMAHQGGNPLMQMLADRMGAGGPPQQQMGYGQGYGQAPYQPEPQPSLVQMLMRNQLMESLKQKMTNNLQNNMVARSVAEKVVGEDMDTAEGQLRAAAIEREVATELETQQAEEQQAQSNNILNQVVQMKLMQRIMDDRGISLGGSFGGSLGGSLGGLLG